MRDIESYERHRMIDMSEMSKIDIMLEIQTEILWEIA